MKSKILIPHPDHDEVDPKINAAFSFRPFVEFLKRRVAQGPGATPDLYHYIISCFEARPAILGPIRDAGLMDAHYDLVQLAVSSLYALTRTTDSLYFHLSLPYRFEIVYQSHATNPFFHTNGDNYILFHEGFDRDTLKLQQELLAYRLLLSRFYGYGLAVTDESYFPHRSFNEDPHQYRTFIDESFIDVELAASLPPFPEACFTADHRLADLDRLRRELPLAGFRFEGFLVRRIEDTSMEQALVDVKNALVGMHTDEMRGYDQLLRTLVSLVPQGKALVSFLPFIRLNGRYVLPDSYASRSILFSRIRKAEDRDQLYDKLGEKFRTEKDDLVFSDVQATNQTALLERSLTVLPFSGYMLRPLYDQEVFLGILELNYDGSFLSNEVLGRLEQLRPYLQLAMRNSIRHFHGRIDRQVKEHFTPLQPSVEWKFAEKAWEYQRLSEQGLETVMGQVDFDNVYPVYGMIDIRNSSGERNRCIRRDLLDQLQLISDTISEMKNYVSEEETEHLANIMFRNEVMRGRVADVLKAEDEMRVSDYLEQEIKSLFRHYGRGHEHLDVLAKRYLQSVDPVHGHLFRHRRDFDDSVALINDTVSKYLENEEAKLQKVFPHYFDKFKSDGIEYDIFIGQAIARNRNFDHMYLRNVRLWQLSSMAEIARLTASLQPEMKIPLQTTQLILVHSQPIRISFRRDERRFDVEGGQNIRYELVKKRIDKVRTKGSAERLTQPGTIAIVYTQDREAGEYEEYIRMMRKKGLLCGEMENLELEEVQGLSGLKALRVSVADQHAG